MSVHLRKGMQTYKYKLNVGILINLIHKKPKKAATRKLVGVKWCEIHKEWPINGLMIKIGKNALYLSVSALSTKVLIRDTIFTSPTGDGTAILHGHPRSSNLQGKGSTFISQTYKTLSVGPVPGIKPATSRSAVRRWYLFGIKLPPNFELTSRYGSVHFVVVVVD